MGGLRIPRRSVADNPAALVVGGRMMRAIEQVRASVPVDLSSVGKDVMPKEFTEVAERLRSVLCKEFGVEISGKKVQVPLLRAIAKQSADVDTDVPEWLDGKTPLGIDRPITPRGVFPETQPGSLSTESPLDHWRALAGNYSSYEEHKQAADSLLKD